MPCKTIIYLTVSLLQPEQGAYPEGSIHFIAVDTSLAIKTLSNGSAAYQWKTPLSCRMFIRTVNIREIGNFRGVKDANEIVMDFKPLRPALARSLCLIDDDFFYQLI